MPHLVAWRTEIQRVALKGWSSDEYHQLRSLPPFRDCVVRDELLCLMLCVTLSLDCPGLMEAPALGAPT